MRRAPRCDEASSPVIGTILMVAAAVGVAVALGVWLAPLGGPPPAAPAGAFAVRAVDLPPGLPGGPAGDADAFPDALEVTYLRGSLAFDPGELTFWLDGAPLTSAPAPGGGIGWARAGLAACASAPPGGAWSPGGPVYVWAAVGDCGVQGDLRGAPVLKAAARGRVVLDTTAVEVRDAP